MNDHLTIGEILSSLTTPRKNAARPREAARPSEPAAAEESEKVDMVVDGRGGPAAGVKERVESPMTGPARDPEINTEPRTQTPDSQATMLMHFERMALPSVALANRMADEFEQQMERSQAELKYARQRANLAWSAVAFMALALLYLGWWTGGSIEGSRVTARTASDTVTHERQRLAAQAGELVKLREALAAAQEAEREQTKLVIDRITQAQASVNEFAARAADAERRLAEATATIALLEGRLDALYASRPIVPAQTGPQPGSSQRDARVPESLRGLVEPGRP